MCTWLDTSTPTCDTAVLARHEVFQNLACVPTKPLLGPPFALFALPAKPSHSAERGSSLA